MDEKASDGTRVGDPLEVRRLWGIQWRPDDTHPWRQANTDREDAAVVLREYDFSRDKHPDLQHRLITTDVFIWEADTEALRAHLMKDNDSQDDTVLQSE